MTAVAGRAFQVTVTLPEPGAVVAMIGADGTVAGHDAAVRRRPPSCRPGERVAHRVAVAGAVDQAAVAEDLAEAGSDDSRAGLADDLEAGDVGVGGRQLPADRGGAVAGRGGDRLSGAGAGMRVDGDRR